MSAAVGLARQTQFCSGWTAALHYRKIRGSRQTFILDAWVSSFIDSCPGWQGSWHLEIPISPISPKESSIEPSGILNKTSREHTGSVSLGSYSALQAHHCMQWDVKTRRIVTRMTANSHTVQWPAGDFSRTQCDLWRCESENWERWEREGGNTRDCDNWVSSLGCDGAAGGR